MRRDAVDFANERFCVFMYELLSRLSENGCAYFLNNLVCYFFLIRICEDLNL